MRASRVADVMVAGESRVDLALAVARLGERGFGHVLAEGGPSLNGALAGAGVLDELCLTLAPHLVAGESKRILTGPPLAPAPALTLRSLCDRAVPSFRRWVSCDHGFPSPGGFRERQRGRHCSSSPRDGPAGSAGP